MSRGLGRLQRGLWETIQQHGKPMTFEEMRAVIRQVFEMEDGAKLYPPFERSLRRALHRMVDNGGLIAIGSGGRADPYRYFMHPMVIAMAMPEETETLMERLAADPGANEALNKCLAKDMAGIEAAQKA
jgi:hypothetical protein